MDSLGRFQTEPSGHRLKCPVEVLFVDEAHFSNEPYLQRGWFRRPEESVLGEQTRTPQSVQRQRVSLFGALQLGSQRFYWK